MNLEEVKSFSAESIGKQLAEALGWKTKYFTKQEVYKNFSMIRDGSWWYKYENEWHVCFGIADDLNVIAEIEEIVCEKTPGTFGYWLIQTVGGLPKQIYGKGFAWNEMPIEEVSRATGRQRIEALLLALTTEKVHRSVDMRRN